MKISVTKSKYEADEEIRKRDDTPCPQCGNSHASMQKGYSGWFTWKIKEARYICHKCGCEFWVK